MTKKKMMVNSFDFQQLISPIKTEEFFSDYWETKPLILNDRPFHGYEGLISFKDVDYLLSSLTCPFDFYSRTPWLRLINNKNELRVEDYLHSETRFLDMEKLMGGFKNGNTIVLDALHRRWEPIQQLSYRLEELLGHSVGVNMYLTPSNAQGFQAHYDPHDVFILQIEGEKLWKIYDQHVEFPIGTKDYPFAGPLNSSTYEVYLKPGDFLYLPRGVVHEATTAKKSSLHLTIGIHVLTWLDLIKEMALKNPRLRKALPRKSLLSNSKERIKLKDLQPLKKLCEDEAILQDAMRSLQAKFSESRNSSFHRYLTLFPEIERVTEKTFFKRRKDGQWKISIEGEHVLIHYKDICISAPIHLKPILKQMQDVSQFSVQTLSGHLPQKDRLTLVRALLKNGLLDLV